MWTQSSAAEQGGWAILVQAHEEGCTEENAKGSSLAVAGLGFLLTWHTQIGMTDPNVRNLLDRGVGGDEIAPLLAQSGHVNASFEEFTDFLGRLCEEAGLDWWSGAMEVCSKGSYDARIHLHAFLCVDPSKLPESGDLGAAVLEPGRIQFQAYAPPMCES